MKNEIEQLKHRIKKLEDENEYLKNLLTDAGIRFEKSINYDSISVSYEQARLFFSYFWGRTDVYAKRYKNKKTGDSGYFPQCKNFWKYGVCPKAERSKIQCKDCENKSWIKLGAKQIEAHLRGEATDCSDVIGVYPLFPDGTCRFLVFDFDNHGNKNDDFGFEESDLSWVDEVDTLRKICRLYNVPILIERSRSGHGAHVWIFFEKAIKAAIARKFGMVLLAKGAENVNLTSFRFYDRMLPAQDKLVANGLGNLIALPLQGQSVKKGNSVFIDENWNIYPDQWKALINTKKISQKWIEDFFEMYALSAENSNDNPWERESSFDRCDVDGNINITLSNCIFIKKTNLTPKLQNQIRRLAAVSNPIYFKNRAMGLSNFDNTRYIYMGYDDSDYICVPRGLLEVIETNAENAGITVKVQDMRCQGQSIDVIFKGQLREEQIQAVNSVMDKDTGIISAATAFGKTVVCSNLIASKKVNTLILLESSALIEQWQNAIEQFLEIHEEFPKYLTPTGRIKKRQSLVGIIHGPKDTSTGIIDIAMAGSLKKKGEFHKRLKTYGMVIVDECHHSASDTMSAVLMESNARYVYGVTATPFRGDGLEAINNMLLGPVRFQYTAKERAKSQGIAHLVIPRFTRLASIHDQGKLHVNDAYEMIKDSKIRNAQICEDIRACIESGRTPVVLSKYKEHAESIFEAVKNDADQVFLLTGALPKKQQKEIRERMNHVSDEESLILVATGQLVGEGFDFPRLDTLIMATPVAWKGVVEQYAGRLNRDYAGKTDVRIYDYVDSNIRIFDNMYAKRLKAYRRIGYSLYAEDIPQKQKADSIYDYESYKEVYIDDIKAAEKSIVIASPSLNYRKVSSFLNTVKPLQERGIKITVLTWDPEIYRYGDPTYKSELLAALRDAGIEVLLQRVNCQHYAVVDNSVVWYGSMNLLGKEDIEDNIMRITSEEIAAELLEISYMNTRQDENFDCE